MQVKKFEAPTIQEALDTIKRELGPEAIILQTKQNRGGFGLLSKASVEVTAAVSERAIQKKKFTDTRLPEKTREVVKNLPAQQQAGIYDKYLEKHLEKSAQQTQDKVEVNSGKKMVNKGLTARRYVDIPDEEGAAPAVPMAGQVSSATRVRAAANAARMTLEDEVKHLKQMLHEMKANQDERMDAGSAELVSKALSGTGSLLTPSLQSGFEQLLINGVDKRYALAVVKKVAFELGAERSQNPDTVLDQIAMEIMNTTEIVSPLAGIQPRGARTDVPHEPVVMALVGPTGVGKTTTLAKIASEALLKRNLKVGLINIDSYKVAAFDQLATYAKILNVPFRSASSAEDLKAAIQDFQGLDLVLVDTTGRSQRDPESLREMEALLHSIPSLQTQLVLSATTRDPELYDMTTRFSLFRPQGIILSKLDEATIYGAVYNVFQKSKLPLVYFTTGQRVPEDIEEASRERVVSLIMDL